MRLDFNVLWVDDQPNRVQAQIDAIAKQMEAEGFRFNPTLRASIAAVRSLVADNVFTDEVDLILVDWDLGGNVTGENAIAAIREGIPYKDVVFYSAAKPAEELRGLAYANNLEGIYCASREDLVEEVMGVFESLVKKVLDLDHTRGIVMGATSDIDHMVNQCLLAIHGKLDGASQKRMLDEALERIEERIKEVTDHVGELRQNPTIASLFDAHAIFTAYDRLRMLSRILKEDAFKQHSTARGAVVTYMQRAVPGRNNLGHLVLVPEGRPQAVATAEGKQVTLAETRELRRLILGLRQDFRSLLAVLHAAADDVAPSAAAPGGSK